jgi:protein MpaA
MSWSKVACQQSPDGQFVEAYQANADAKEYTYCIAGTHGDEVESVLLMHAWLGWLQEQKNLPNLLLIPVLNVDGLARGTRVNANGVDLNRNYPASNWHHEATEPRYHPGQYPLSEIENQFLSELLIKYPAREIISIHSWKSFVQYDDKRVSGLAEYFSEKNNIPIIHGDIESHPTPGSLSSWAQEALDVPVLTVELPEIDHHQPLSDILNLHLPIFKGLVNDKII